MKTLLSLLLVVCAWHNAAALDNLDTVWLKKYTRDIVKMKYSPDDKYLLTTNLVQGDVIAMPSGQALAYLGGVSSMEWSKDGKWFVTWVVTGAGNKLVRFETGTWRAMDTMYLPTGDDEHHAMTLAPDNRTLAISWSGNAKKSIQFYDLIEHKLIKETVYYNPGVTLPVPQVFEAQEMFYTPDSRYIIFHATDWQIRFFDIAADSVVYKYQFGGGGLFLTMTEDGSKIAFTTHKKDIIVEIMDVSTRQIISSIEGTTNQATGLAFSPDGLFLSISSRYLGRLYVYKILSKERIREWGSGSVLDVAYSHDGKYIITNVGKTLLLYNAPKPVDVKENNPLIEPELYPNPVSNILTLGFNNDNGNEIGIKISTISGIIKKQELYSDIHLGYNEFRIEVSDLPSGIYIAKLQAGNTYRNIRFIKI